jgi:tRNA modification GTPase
MPVHVTDTAGLRHSDDVVEKEGIRRAIQAINSADRIILVVDASQDNIDLSNLPSFLKILGLNDLLTNANINRLSIVKNKIDLTGNRSGVRILEHESHAVTEIALSAKSQEGIDQLRRHLKDCMGYCPSGEGGFIARRRHLEALNQTKSFLEQAKQQLESRREGELIAEDLKQAHRCLGEITGEFTTDDLLGKIFSSFCVGK